MFLMIDHVSWREIAVFKYALSINSSQLTTDFSKIQTNCLSIDYGPIIDHWERTLESFQSFGKILIFDKFHFATQYYMVSRFPFSIRGVPNLRVSPKGPHEPHASH